MCYFASFRVEAFHDYRAELAVKGVTCCVLPHFQVLIVWGVPRTLGLRTGILQRRTILARRRVTGVGRRSPIHI